MSKSSQYEKSAGVCITAALLFLAWTGEAVVLGFYRDWYWLAGACLLALACLITALSPTVFNGLIIILPNLGVSLILYHYFRRQLEDLCGGHVYDCSFEEQRLEFTGSYLTVIISILSIILCWVALLESCAQSQHETSLPQVEHETVIVTQHPPIPHPEYRLNQPIIVHTHPGSPGQLVYPVNNAYHVQAVQPTYQGDSSQQLQSMQTQGAQQPPPQMSTIHIHNSSQ